MALIPTPTPSVYFLQAQLVQNMTQVDQMVFQVLLRTFNDQFNSVWNNKDLTPQQVMDAFGTHASQLFINAQATETFLNTITPGTITFTPPYHYTIHEDGNVTVGDKI